MTEPDLPAAGTGADPYAGSPHTPTGNPAVDDALAGLAAVAEAPPAEQVGPLTEAHRVLTETLDAIGDV